MSEEIKRYDINIMKFGSKNYAELLKEIVSYINMFIVYHRGIYSKDSFDLWLDIETFDKASSIEEHDISVINLINIIYPQAKIKIIGKDDI